MGRKTALAMLMIVFGSGVLLSATNGYLGQTTNQAQSSTTTATGTGSQSMTSTATSTTTSAGQVQTTVTRTSATTVTATSVSTSTTTTTSTSISTTTTTVTARPSAQINVAPTSGPPGATIAIGGWGFQPNRNATLTFGGSLVSTIATKPDGTFASSFVVPTVPGGRYNLSANGLAGASSTSFTVTPSISVFPASGTGGTLMTITCKGFPAYDALIIKWGTTTIATGTTASDGTFSIRLDVPPSTLQSYSITATDSSGNSASTTYTVTG